MSEQTEKDVDAWGCECCGMYGPFGTFSLNANGNAICPVCKEDVRRLDV